MRILFLESHRGRYEELKYASCVAKKFAEELRRKGHDVIEIERPTPEQANEAIKRYRPDIVWFVGHGYADRATLEEVREWITISRNIDILRNTVTVAHSCLTGIRLGKEAVRRGAVAYLGYTEEFWFLWCDDERNYNCACEGRNPYGARQEVWRKLVTYPHYPPLVFLREVAGGRDLKSAFDESIETAKRLIKELESITPASPSEGAMIKVAVWSLDGNKDSQVLYVGSERAGEVEEKEYDVKRALISMLMLTAPVLGLIMVGGGYAGKEVHNI